MNTILKPSMAMRHSCILKRAPSAWLVKTTSSALLLPAACTSSMLPWHADCSVLAAKGCPHCKVA